MWHSFFSRVFILNKAKWSSAMPFTFHLHNEMLCMDYTLRLLLLARPVYTVSAISFAMQRYVIPHIIIHCRRSLPQIVLNGRQHSKIKSQKSWKMLNREDYVSQNLFMCGMVCSIYASLAMLIWIEVCRRFHSGN